MPERLRTMQELASCWTRWSVSRVGCGNALTDGSCFGATPQPFTNPAHNHPEIRHHCIGLTLISGENAQQKPFNKRSESIRQPRLYAARGRNISKTSPPKTEIIRMRLRSLKPA
jgi:hypothetical protein